MHRVLLSLAACTLCAAVAPSAHAAMEVWQSPVTASLSSFGGDIGFTYPVPLFDRQGGARTLTGVQISGSVTLTAQTQVFNAGVTLADFSIRYDAGFVGTLPGGGVSAFQSEQRSELALFPNAFRDINFLLTADVIGSVGDIAAYSSLNGGSVTQQGTFSAGLTLPPRADLTWNPASLQLGGSITITYAYQLVPAPASALALLAGGAALPRRRRR